ncbi:MAG: peptidyl-prolyl cis-trans isomerase [Magnetospirillum sp.]|nr:peptidyl-prolyl cis-trans isomerase [Magnetospirillum sp.]
MAAQIRASHILLMYKGSMRSQADRSQKEAQASIENIRDELAQGADFAQLARQYSDCPSSEEGGDLGYFGKGSMVPEFEEAAFDLGKGDVSDVVETSFGYHLIQRTD